MLANSLLLQEDCCERLANCCCFRATCFASCDTPILATQRKVGVYKRADAPAALASRIKVYAATSLLTTSFVFLLVLGILFASWFRDVGDIVTFSMGIIPIVLPIIPLSVAVHQFSKGRLGRRLPSNCCSLGATTFPSIAGSLYNWMILCSIFATFAFATTLSVIAARSGSGMAQNGLGYAYGWCGTGLIEDNYWDDYGSWCGYGNGLYGDDCSPIGWKDGYDNESDSPNFREYIEAEAAEVPFEQSDGGSGGAMFGSGSAVKHFSYETFKLNEEEYFGTDTLESVMPFNYDYNNDIYNTVSYTEPTVHHRSGPGHGHLTVYILLLLFQTAAMVLQILLALSLQRFKVAMLELGDGSASRSINLSVHEAQHLWQLQVGGGDANCNADGSYDV